MFRSKNSRSADRMEDTRQIQKCLCIKIGDCIYINICIIKNTYTHIQATSSFVFTLFLATAAEADSLL